MQRARCYLLGETAVVLELEPPVTLASQKRIWRLVQRAMTIPDVVDAIPGMNNVTVVLRDPQETRWMPLSVYSAGGKKARRWSRIHALSRSR